MYPLNDEQRGLVEADVKKAHLTLRKLSDELIDHICCMIEEEMWKGASFIEAYKSVKKEIEIEILKQIQKDTLYLTDKKYRIMKTTLKITGNFSLALLSIGTVFKIMHWPGASVSFVLGFAIMILFSFPSSIYLYHREIKRKYQTVLSVSILLGGMATMLGFLFKIMHWPGSSAFLLTGLSLVVWVFLPLLLLIKIKEPILKKEKIIYAIGIIALMIFELAFTFKLFHWPGANILMVVGSALLAIFFLPLFTSVRYKNNPALFGEYIFVIIFIFYLTTLTMLTTINTTSNTLQYFITETQNTSLIANYYQQNKNTLATQNSQLFQSGKELRDYIKELQLILIQKTEKIDEPTAFTYLANPLLINAKDNYDIPNSVLTENNNERLILLDKKIKNFCDEETKLFPKQNNTISRIFYGGDLSENTILFRFQHVTLINVIGILNNFNNYSLALENGITSKK